VRINAASDDERSVLLVSEKGFVERQQQTMLLDLFLDLTIFVAVLQITCVFAVAAPSG
jgi:hypothetical protein